MSDPGEKAERGLPPHLFVVFGGAGDLARRELLPAVQRLHAQGVLDEQRLLTVDRDPEHDDESYREWVREALRDAGVEGRDAWCDRCVSYQHLDGSDGDLRAVARRIESLEHDSSGAGNRVFYLAVPPAVFPSIVDGLGRAGLAHGEGFARLVVEKPFGHDLESARELDATVHRWFDEEQVYRIDHFLGKETVQNLLVLRCANAVLESLWSRELVDSVQITVAEPGGVRHRAGYYDGIGALRDMVQNHLFQVLCLFAMEPPARYDSRAIRGAKVALLRAMRPLDPAHAVFGRYTSAPVDGERVRGYLEEDGVPPDSGTETFAAVRVSIDNWRWQGVPFYLRSGKRMAQALTEIVVSFRRPPVALFESQQRHEVGQDVLVVRLQPDEGFALEIDVKRPGGTTLEKVPLDFRYASRFGPLPDAYVTLLADVLHGDPTLFVHTDEVERAWEVCQPLLDRGPRVFDYPAGSWGPEEAERLLARDGRIWRNGP